MRLGTPRSLRVQLALWHGLILAVALIGYTLAVYFLDMRGLSREIDESLASRAGQARRVVERNPRFGERPLEIELPGTFSSANFFVEVVTLEGRTLGSSENLEGRMLPVDAEDLAEVRAGRARYKDSVVGGERLRIYTAPLDIPDNPIDVIQVARPLEPLESAKARLARIATFGLPIVLVLSVLGVWLMTSRALRPLDELAGTAEAIGNSQDLSRRVATARSGTEVGRLAAAFNRMLERLQGSDNRLREAYARLETALESQKRFVANASHELRTPLTTIRGNAGMLRRHANVTPEDRAAALAQISYESERMSRLVQHLLTLARADSGQTIERVPVSFHPLVQDVVSQAKLLTKGHRLEVGVLDPVEVAGDPDSLRQLLLILLDNAIRYTLPPGIITVRLERRIDEARLVVEDTGVGITPEDLPRIFERFYRGNHSRSADGAGLGLSIAQWIAEQHGGAIEVTSTPGRGSTFTVRLPLRDAPRAWDNEPERLEELPTQAV